MRYQLHLLRFCGHAPWTPRAWHSTVTFRSKCAFVPGSTLLPALTPFLWLCRQAVADGWHPAEQRGVGAGERYQGRQDRPTHPLHVSAPPHIVAAVEIHLPEQRCCMYSLFRYSNYTYDLVWQQMPNVRTCAENLLIVRIGR